MCPARCVWPVPVICRSRIAQTVISLSPAGSGVFFYATSPHSCGEEKAWTSTLLIWIVLCLFFEMVFLFAWRMGTYTSQTPNILLNNSLNGVFFNLRFHWQSIPKGSWDEAMDSCYETSKMYWKACLLWCCSSIIYNHRKRWFHGLI